MIKMKAQRILFGVLALAITACDDYNDNFEGLDDIVNESQSNVVSGVTYELTESDYSTIGGYTGDTDEETALLKTVKSNKAFPSDALAQKYLTKFAASKWYTADKGSAVTISYNVSGDTPEYVTKVANATTYELTSDDYAKVWGSVKAEYLTKSTVSNIPSILSSAVTGAESGDYALVSYEYSESEPSSSSDDDTPECHWAKISGGTYPEGKSWSYVQSGNIDISAYAGQTVRLAFRYQSTSSLAGTVEVKNINVADAAVSNYVTPVLFAAQADGSYAKASSFSGAGKYLVLAEADGKYYAFGKIKGGNSYGYCVSDPVTVTDDVVSADDAAAISIEFEAASNGFYLKNSDNVYLYMKGTYDSFNSATATGDDEGYNWTVSVSNGNVDIVNVLTSKTVRYDTKYSSYGSYAGSKLGVCFSNSLLSADLPEGFIIKDVTLPSAASYIWQMTANYGAKASAYISKVNYESDSWLITSEIDLSSATSPYLSVDWAANFFNGNSVEDYLGVYVSTDYEDGADFNVSGTKSLKASVATDSKLAIYTYDGSAWSVPSNVLVVNPSDYKAMGISSNSFSSSNKPATYLPAFFKTNLPYALDGAQAAAAYYYGSTLEAVEYTYTDGAWAESATYTTSSGQFVKSSSWMYDPCVTLNLPYDRSDATAKEFYQMVTDWVWTNIDVKENNCSNKGEGYVTSYGNNEYYTGSSAYYNNVDWRVSKATAQTSAYDGMTDEQVFEQMQTNLIKTYAKVLALKYPNAEPVDGIDVIYTINFVAYYSKENNGSNAGVSYTIQYKVTAPATFEYVEDSLKEVE